MERDGGNLFVLEGIIISLILLGAAYAISDAQRSSLDNVRPRAELDRLVADALTVLAGLDNGNGTKLLDLYMLEAMHCSFDAAPSATDCQQARSKNLSLKLDHYLPLGGGWAIGLGNGAAVRDVWRSPLPQGEAVAASRNFAPEWNTSFAYTDFSCYPAGDDANATLIPIDRARTSWARHGNVTIGTTEYAGERAFHEDWWNVTIPGATRPSTGTIKANVTGNGTFPGLTSYGVCGHDGLTGALLDAMKLVPYTTSAPSVPVGSSVDFSVDLAPIEALASVQSATITLYSPLPTRPDGADTWLRAGDVVDLAGGAGPRTGTWHAPSTSLYGSHPALLRVTLDTGTNVVEMRRAILIDVALPTGEVPYEPFYRAVLTGWLADWG